MWKKSSGESVILLIALILLGNGKKLFHWTEL